MLFMDTPSSKWEKDEKRINKICFIGRNLDRQVITDGIYSCIVTEELRFQVGDRVDCYMGKDTWEEGTVVKQWDMGNAYRVNLESGEDVWAAMDEDSFITKSSNI